MTNSENLSLGLFVGLIFTSITATIFAVGYANAPVKGCDYLTDKSPEVIQFCSDYVN